MQNVDVALLKKIKYLLHQDPGALSTNTQMMELTNLPSPDAEDKKLLQTDL